MSKKMTPEEKELTQAFPDEQFGYIGDSDENGPNIFVTEDKSSIAPKDAQSQLVGVYKLSGFLRITSSRITYAPVK